MTSEQVIAKLEQIFAAARDDNMLLDDVIQWIDSEISRADLHATAKLYARMEGETEPYYSTRTMAMAMFLEREKGRLIGNPDVTWTDDDNLEFGVMTYADADGKKYRRFGLPDGGGEIWHDMSFAYLADHLFDWLEKQESEPATAKQ